MGWKNNGQCTDGPCRASHFSTRPSCSIQNFVSMFSLSPICICTAHDNLPQRVPPSNTPQRFKISTLALGLSSVSTAAHAHALVHLVQMLNVPNRIQSSVPRDSRLSPSLTLAERSVLGMYSCGSLLLKGHAWIFAAAELDIHHFTTGAGNRNIIPQLVIRHVQKEHRLHCLHRHCEPSLFIGRSSPNVGLICIPSFLLLLT